MTTFKLARILLVGALGCACAATPRPRPEAPARVADTAPDKAAALRAAPGNLHQQEDEDRWAVEAARDRKRRADEQKAEAATRAAALGPVDDRPPAAPPTPAAP